MGVASKTILIVTDTYYPVNISASIQMTDLANEFARLGYRLLVVTPLIKSIIDPDDHHVSSIDILRVKCLTAKDSNYFYRGISEFLMPFLMIRELKKLRLDELCVEGIIWYSPTIFFGPLIYWAKRKFKCKSYLILRDLFPDWAVDAGVMRKGLIYRVLKLVEKYQYRQADVIGLQTPANLPHLQPWQSDHRQLEVLPNWLALLEMKHCSLKIADTALAGRKIFVYAGNMGVAQDINPIIDMVASLQSMRDWGFLFVGRGSEVDNIRRRITADKLDNIVLRDEIQPHEIPGLFAQCHIGIVALDPRHTTHNIPGKFIAYMRSGLPVLARINKGNDLKEVIHSYGVGIAIDEPGQAKLQLAALELMALPQEVLSAQAKAAKDLWEAQYSAEACALQILSRLGHRP